MSKRFIDENGRECVFIELCNETTASAYKYIASPEMGELLSALTESELGQLMPKQEVFDPAEAEGYAGALRAHALFGGMPEEKAWIEPLDVDAFWFESGWKNGGGKDVKSTKVSTKIDKQPTARTRKPIWENPIHEFFVPAKINAISTEGELMSAMASFVPEGWVTWQYGLDRGGNARGGERLVCMLAREYDGDVNPEMGDFATYKYSGNGKFSLEAYTKGAELLSSVPPADGAARTWKPTVDEIVAFVNERW